MDSDERLAGKRISDGGVFPNGVGVVAILRFIRAYEYEAPIDDVAKHFGLEREDVAAALAFYSRNFDWIHPLVVAGER